LVLTKDKVTQCCKLQYRFNRLCFSIVDIILTRYKPLLCDKLERGNICLCFEPPYS